VRQAGGLAHVEAASGEHYAARCVVVAVPAAVLPEIGFDPPLTAEKRSALHALRY
jgi:monoamine oxidase